MTEQPHYKNIALFINTAYNQNMHAKIECNPAAFKHGVSETDIRNAIDMLMYEDPLDNFDNKY